MSKFIDQARIEICSGDGGNGIIAWRREKYEPLGGPAGGNGGRGGHIYIQASKDITTLVEFRHKSRFFAAAGRPGGSKLKSGAAGDDLTIKVPVGTLVKDYERQELIADLNKPNMRLLIAEGGKGGRGNAAFTTPKRRAPHFCEPGQPGVKRHLELNLKLLADVGLVGLPNAGKSTLLKAMTRAKPKIASYPFSTLEPGLGVVEKSRGDGYVIADIPGLIAGASKGAGLGHNFLRHIERTRLILHLVDISSENLEADITIINNELQSFSPELSNRERLIVLTKVDLVSAQEGRRVEAKISHSYPSCRIIAISASAHRGLDQLGQVIEEKLSAFARQIEAAPDKLIIDENALVHKDEDFTVSRKRHKFVVEGEGITRLVSVTDSQSPESLQHLNQQLKNLGVIDQLIKLKIETGNEILIGGLSFCYGENLF